MFDIVHWAESGRRTVFMQLDRRRRPRIVSFEVVADTGHERNCGWLLVYGDYAEREKLVDCSTLLSARDCVMVIELSLRRH
uniref:Uncharacterized protein n=1 Tax=Peronospora matthiolae TaxID=2874970 RepID=A0AAV1T307_9STRA